MAAEPTTDASAVEPPQKRSLGRTYWLCNVIEMWERLAYYVLRPVAPIYIAQATEPGGLHLTQSTKGWIYAWWAVFQSFLPMVTGGYADRYGYKKTLAFSVTMNIIGYTMMAFLHSYYGFFGGIIVLAIGTAFFKPSLQATLAHNLTKATSSLGWGIFYWIVNVGSLIGHYASPLLLGSPHSAEGWRTMFLFCAGCTAMNYLMLFTFKDVPSGASKTESPLHVFGRTIANLFDARLITWLLIMSCFWLMMYQLWDLQPNFIEDWIDSSMVAAHVPFDSWQEWGDQGLIRVPQQVLISLNALLIVVLMVPVSWAVRKLRTLSAMFFGMVVATSGLLVAGLTGNGWFLLLGILFFSLGEMLTGPKKNEYLALIAPPGKKGLYLGYVNIPIGVGVFLGSLIAGYVYGYYGEKATLALKHLAANPQLVARAAQSADWSDSLEKIPHLLNIDRRRAFELARADLNVDARTAAQSLRRDFRYDQGQAQNLALQYLALHPEYRERTITGFAQLVVDLGKELDSDAEALVDQVETLLKPLEEPEEPEQGMNAGLPAADKILRDAEDIKAMVARVRGLATGETKLDEIALANVVHLLPDIVGKTRQAAIDAVRELINNDLPDEQAKEDTQIVDMLWQRFGDDPEVLNNLALEYLAQGTTQVHDAVANLTFKHSPEELDERIKEIEDRIGIGRTKSFAALSAAMGADDAAVDEALNKLGMPAAGQDERAFAYLIQRPHHRFIAVARKNWMNDQKLLQAIVTTDDNTRNMVLAEIDRETWYQKAWSAIVSIFVTDKDEGEVAEDGVNYHKLAGKQDLIQKALDAKDWSNASKEAAQLLGLSAFEARALVAAEVANSPEPTTRLLWEEYNPQYKVWIPFAAIGVVAAIALAIFGQLAKRWKDMNA